MSEYDPKVVSGVPKMDGTTPLNLFANSGLFRIVEPIVSEKTPDQIELFLGKTLKIYQVNLRGQDSHKTLELGKSDEVSKVRFAAEQVPFFVKDPDYPELKLYGLSAIMKTDMEMEQPYRVALVSLLPLNYDLSVVKQFRNECLESFPREIVEYPSAEQGLEQTVAGIKGQIELLRNSEYGNQTVFELLGGVR